MIFFKVFRLLVWACDCFLFILEAEALVFGFDDFPIYFLIGKAKAFVLPTFQNSGGLDSWFIMLLFLIYRFCFCHS